ncbi:hypothetical protein ACFLV3_04775 [Chloroflexota bacterium]
MDTISFSRNLNLLNDADVSTFFEESLKSGYILPVKNEDDLKRIIHFAKDFLPISAFEISAGITAIGAVRPSQIRAWEAFGFIRDILPIACFLYALKDDLKFLAKVKTKLANLPQVNDTFFELKCLSRFITNGFAFEYEPKIEEGGEEKSPDFRLTIDASELYCECKQVRVGQNVAELQFAEDCKKIRGKFSKALEGQLFDKKLRLEICFRKNLAQISPDHVDRLLGQLTRLSNSAVGIGELPLTQLENDIEYCIIPQTETRQFPVRTMVSVSMRFTAGKPRRIWNAATDSHEGEIAFYSLDLARRRLETLGRDIRAAKNQLPKGKFGIIVINRAQLAIAKQAIERRMNSEYYNDIIAVVVNPFNDFLSCYRPEHRTLLSSLFEGFQPENPFRQI